MPSSGEVITDAGSGKVFRFDGLYWEQVGIRCPQCGRTTYNPNDIDEGYCGACHDWTQEGGPDGT